MEFTESLKEQIKGALQGADGPVELVVYKGEEPFSEEVSHVVGLLKGIRDFLPNVQLEEKGTKEGLLGYPAIEIHAPGEKANYVYYGLPAELEFATLVETIRTVAAGAIDLDEGLVSKIKAIKSPISLEVFVTPTCPHCPTMAIAGFRVSRINPLIHTSVVEATSFRPYARGKGVMGVPKTFMNDGQMTIDGAIGIEEFVEKLSSL